MELGELSHRINAISARYAQVYGFERDADWLLLKLHEEVGELTQAHLSRTKRSKTRGKSEELLEQQFALELADALGLLLALAAHEGVDIEQAVQDKWLVWDERASQHIDDHPGAPDSPDVADAPAGAPDTSTGSN
ncbi:hypothetical protein [Humidisolicoccus flavus]|uniref:hypothetical protein n=1 Tax=Humidisolicoccus flavus TaxID=3111414 RepID=UPI003252EDD6